MNWLFIVIFAHLLYAGVFIIDRYLLKRTFSNPLCYAFWTGILGIFVFLLAPFGLKIPSTNLFILSLIAGLFWFLAIIVFYNALQKGESSRVVPIVGGFIPIFTLVLSFVFLSERLTLKELVAFLLLVAGSILISLTKRGNLTKAFVFSVGAALIFSIYFVITKYVFLNQNFISGLIWIRLGAFLGAISLLFFSFYRRRIFNRIKIVEKETIGFFSLARGLGAVASLLIYWAIFLGSVTLVNAMQGVQYLFVLLLAFFLFRKIPSLREQFGKETLYRKVFAIILISAGLVILVV
jgi:drug/metabolite transporter (DMT)-like permease